MTFLQSIEFQGEQAQFEQLLDRYREIMGSDTTAKRAWLLADRDHPGTFVELVEFDSYESAMTNSEHPGTQAWAQEAESMLGGAVFRNLDLVGTYEI
jgi:hypothetical protein